MGNETGTLRVKTGLAEMLKGGGIMDGAPAGPPRTAQDAGAMMRARGEAGTGEVVEAVRHRRRIGGKIRQLAGRRSEGLAAAAKQLGAPFELVRQVGATGRLPVVNFSAGGLATPADAALMMQLGADGNFVGSGIFKSEDPASRARAIVEATTYFNDPEILAKVSRSLGEPMRGLEISELGEEGLLQTRGWERRRGGCWCSGGPPFS